MINEKPTFGPGSTHSPLALLVAASLFLAVASAGEASAATEPEAACSAKKQGAAGAKAKAVLACHAKAAKAGVAVDPECLTKANGKFNTAFNKADDAYACVVEGDGPTISALVDSCVASITGVLPSESPTCGDANAEYPEDCDVGDLNGETCLTLGFASGALACQLGCTFDVSDCVTNILEVEPNDDGSTAVATNDFSSVNANGPYTGNTFISASIGLAGDDDVFLVENTSGSPVVLSVETHDGSGPGFCALGTDTVLNIRDQFGVSLASNDDSGVNNCSLVSGYVLAPGAEAYVHVIEFGDNLSIPAYTMSILFNP